MSGFETTTAPDGETITLHRTPSSRDTPYASVVVFPSIFGVTDDLIAYAEGFAAAGAETVVLDPFSRWHAGPAGHGEAERAFARVADLDRELVNADFRMLMAAQRAAPRSDGRVIGLGICLGGPFVWLAAADGLLDAGATWHGSRMHNYMDRAGDVRCPMILGFGGADRFVTMDQVEQVRAACAGSANVEIQIHPGADHGYSHTGWPSHNGDAATAGVEAVTRLIRNTQG